MLAAAPLQDVAQVLDDGNLSGAVRRAWDLYASPQPGSDDSSLDRDATLEGDATEPVAGILTTV